jgi:hypothetical protein
MTNGRFRTDFVYIMVNNPSVLYTVMGTSQTNTLADARLVTMPSALPVELQRLGVLVGRLIIGTNNAAITEVSSAYEITFNASTVINHNDTGNIQGGAVGDYQHVTSAEKANWDGKVSSNGLGVTNRVAKFTSTVDIRPSNYYDDGVNPVVDKGLIVTGVQSPVSSGALTLKLGRLTAIPSNSTDCFVVTNGIGGLGAKEGDLTLISRTSAGVNASVIFATGDVNPIKRAEITSTGLFKIISSIQIGDDTNSATASNAGALRYRTSGNNSYIDMCMQTGAATYAWVNIVSNNW